MRRLEHRPFDLTYSVRRSFIDDFYSRQVASLPRGATVLDVGGRRKGKQGRFNIEEYPLEVEYVNIDPESEPDHLCDATSIPVSDAQYDAVVCSELLEHVRDPPAVLKECYRVLRPEGRALVCVPFMYQIHADPHDYGRYTDQYWRETASALGFRGIDVERQGTIYAVMANLLKIWALHHTGFWLSGKVTRKAACLAAWMLMAVEARQGSGTAAPYRANTTGFGLVLSK